MASHSDSSRRSDRNFSSHVGVQIAPRLRKQFTNYAILGTALAVAIIGFGMRVPRALAQDTPHITSVTPTTGKANDSITITGENLGKDKVAAVFLSDAKLDHKATVMDQEPTKIVIKVPNLKPGDYNISVQEGGAIYIQPVIFKVTA